MTASAPVVKSIALECGFELAGVASAVPSSDFARYRSWVEQEMAGEMTYLTDRRGDLRADPRNLLPSARSIICVGKLYNTDQPYSTAQIAGGHGWISRYAWGEDYHNVMRAGLEQFRSRLSQAYGPFDSKICVDTAPLLERSYAKASGLGWIGKNTCLINQQQGSWFFLGELLVSLDIASDVQAPDRCGTCTRCVDACPTAAIVPDGDSFRLDATRCISYFTIELRGEIPRHSRSGIGTHIFGCDICQDVCPWNGRAAVTQEPAFASASFAPALDKLAALGEEEFRETFQSSPIKRAKYSGFLRNVAVAMGNSGRSEFRFPLERLASGADKSVAEHADWALRQLEQP
jgi:epoxyqueuosine reductase